MCGIAGIIDISSTPERSLIERMCRVMKHRGPDGEGYYTDNNAALGHRRLSIIDLEGGKQPMSNEDGTIWITFNGEIYNFSEIKDELSRKGHRFKTRSDTETIIHAYEEYGEECVKKFRGMFAFGLWDSKRKILFIARDRLGKKPLYYYNDDKKIIFASELKAVLQDRSINREFDRAALVDYLTYNYIPFPETIFKDIYKLPPGHYMTVDVESDLSLTIKQYWDIQYNPDYSVSEDEWAERLREKLKEAVKIRLISDVPLGAFLSGGIDSSAVVSLMSMVQGSRVKTFSIGFKEEEFSELRYAREVADKFGTEHIEMIVEPDAIEMLPALSWEFDEPFADSSAIPTYYVSKMAREHVTVILSGDGGDETFAGYRRYQWARDMQRHDWMPACLKKMLFGFPASVLPEGVKGKGMLEHLSKDPFERFAGLNTFSDKHYLKSLLHRDVLAGVQQNSNGKLPDYTYLRKFYDGCNSKDYLTRIQYTDTKTYLAEDILTKVDRASMLCSLETRAPLLDHEVVELVASVPASLKIKDGETKYILKKAMTSILPDSILYRKKMGFGVPLVHWFKNDLTGYARETLLSKGAKERGIFNPDYIEGMLNSHQKTGRDLSARIWALLFFEHWCRNWIDA
ncbi:MAG: asparagine synthase (glutamine-hydrolyzing) [Nitrospirae bacterium]|nr:asparagine synthase (glutamine-hydrolyzing) [Nitrospirota bacterium]